MRGFFMSAGAFRTGSGDLGGDCDGARGKVLNKKGDFGILYVL
jgi:hypothetical protein